MKRDPNGFIQPGEDIDPAVAAIVGDGRKRQVNATLSTRERKSKAREKAKYEARRERRVMYDIDPTIQALYADLARHHEVPISQLVELAMRLFYANGPTITLYLQPIKSPRYSNRVIMPDVNSGDTPNKL